MRIEKPIVKKFNNGLKVATTIMISSTILFGITTAILLPQTTYLKQQQKQILVTHSESDLFKQFKQYETEKLNLALGSSKLTQKEYEKRSQDLNSSETILNHFKAYASEAKTERYESLEKDINEMDSASKRGLTTSLLSLGCSIGASLLSASIEDKLAESSNSKTYINWGKSKNKEDDLTL